MADARLVAADLLLRIGVDADGVGAELTSKLTAAERAAVQSGDRISANVAKNSQAVQAANLRVVAAQERYNRVLQTSGATQGQVASAQASLISSRRTLARETDKATASTGRLNQGTGRLKSTVAGFIGATAGFAAFSFLRGGLQEVKDFQAGVAQTEAGIRSTGGAANVTARDVQNLAGEVQGYSGLQDDLVVQGQNLLLTFTKVRNEVGKNNDVFDRATIAAADLSVRGFGDMESSAKQLGKALNDPIAGTGALSRAGVQFTANQKATIKSLVETGNILGAQKIILAEVETQVGGSAKAYGETLPGELDKARRSLEQFEQGTIQTVAPALKALAGVATFFAQHKTARDAALFAGGTVAALLAISKGIKIYRDVSLTVFRRVPLQVAANTAEAGSYNTLAVAANRAAIAKGRASGAGPLGGAGRVGAIARTAGVAGIVGTIGYGAVSSFQGNAKDSRVDSLVDQIAGSPQEFEKAKARLAEIKRIAEQRGGAPEFASEFHDLTEAIDRARPKIRELSRKAGKESAREYAEGVKENREALREAAQAFAIDPLGVSQRGANVASARGALDAALRARDKADRAVDEARHDSTVSAEKSLNAERKKGVDTAEQSRNAENRIRDAILSQRDAQRKVNEARENLGEARGLSPEQVLKRLRGNVREQGQLRGDLQTLTAKGVSKEALEALKGLESTAPGTIHRIAEESGKRYQRDFTAALDKLNRQTNAIARLYLGSEDRAARNGKRDAKAYAQAFAGNLEAEGMLLDFKQGGFVPAAPTSGDKVKALPNKVRSGGFPGS